MKTITMFVVIIGIFLSCSPNGGTITDVGSTITGKVLTEKHEPVTDTLTISLFNDRLLSGATQTGSVDTGWLKSVSSFDGVFKFDSLDSGTYRIEVRNDTVKLGEKRNIELDWAEKKTVDLTIINQIFNISIDQSQTTTVNQFYITNGVIVVTDSGYMLTSIEADTTFFEMDIIQDGSIERVKVRVVKDSEGKFRYEVIESTGVTITPAGAPEVTGKTPTNDPTPTWRWTSGGGGKKYRYKLDDPDLSSIAAVTSDTSLTPNVALAEGEHILYIQENVNDTLWSAYGVFTIIIDLTGPAAPVFEDPILITNNSQPLLRWSSGGEGCGTFRFALDDTALSSGDTVTTTRFFPDSELTEGTHTLCVQERDEAGNWSQTGTLTFTIDMTPPSPPVVTGKTPTRNQKPTWTWKSVDGSGVFRFRFGSDDFSPSVTTTTDTSYTPETNLAVEAHTLFIQECDAAGNWSVPTSFTIMIDQTGPHAPVFSDSVVITNNRRPTVTWKSGGNGCGVFRYKLDAMDFSSSDTTSDSSFTPENELSEGTHTLYLQERDAAGNWSAVASCRIVIDTKPPSAPKTSCPEKTNTLRPTWSWSAGEGGNGTYRCKLDSDKLDSGATVTAISSFTPENDIDEGAHTLYIQERDIAGNWSASANCTVVIDISASGGAPTVTGKTPTNDPTPTWSWSSGGGTENYRYKLDDSTLASGAAETTDSSFTPENPLVEGAHTLYIQEQDTMGTWSSTGMFTIVVDTKPPYSPPQFIDGTTPSPTNNQRPTWKWRSSGGSGIFRFRFNNDKFDSNNSGSPVTSYTPETNLAEAVHTIYIQESDAAGNWSTSAAYSIIIDITTPKAPKFPSPILITNDPTPRILWHKSESNDACFKYRCNIDDSNLNNSTIVVNNDTTYLVAENIAEGDHAFYLQVVDSAGNWSERCTLLISIDTTLPPPPLCDPASSTPSPTTDPKPKWRWKSGGGGGGYRYLLDNPNVNIKGYFTNDSSFIPDTNLSEGEHILYILEFDAAGNPSEVIQCKIECNLLYTITWRYWRSCSYVIGQGAPGCSPQDVSGTASLKVGQTTAITLPPCYYTCVSDYGCTYKSFTHWSYDGKFLILSSPTSNTTTITLIAPGNTVLTASYQETTTVCNQ